MRLFCFFATLVALVGALPLRAAEPRLVSVGGTATEIVYALGAQAGLVAVDSTSQYPVEARNLTSIGYFRHLSAEGVLALHPTLVIAAAEAGPPPVLEQIKRAGISVLPLVDGFTEEAVLARIAQVGAALGKTAEAKKLEELVRRDLNRARAMIGRWNDRPKVLFLLSASRGLVAAGDDTAAETIIRLAGGENALSGYTGYKAVTAEAVLAAAPEIILTGTHVIEALGGIEALRDHPDLASVPAARDGRIIVRDSLFLLGFGPRLGAAALDLAQSLRPGAPLPALAVSP